MTLHAVLLNNRLQFTLDDILVVWYHDFTAKLILKEGALLFISVFYCIAKITLIFDWRMLYFPGLPRRWRCRRRTSRSRSWRRRTRWVGTASRGWCSRPKKRLGTGTTPSPALGAIYPYLCPNGDCYHLCCETECAKPNLYAYLLKLVLSFSNFVMRQMRFTFRKHRLSNEMLWNFVTVD